MTLDKSATNLLLYHTLSLGGELSHLVLNCDTGKPARTLASKGLSLVQYSCRLSSAGGLRAEPVCAPTYEMLLQWALVSCYVSLRAVRLCLRSRRLRWRASAGCCGKCCECAVSSGSAAVPCCCVLVLVLLCVLAGCVQLLVCRSGSCRAPVSVCSAVGLLGVLCCA